MTPAEYSQLVSLFLGCCSAVCFALGSMVVR